MAVRIVPHVEVPPPVWAPPRAGFGRLRKIGLLGSHEATLKHCPWDDPSWELWGHSSSRGFYQRPPERYFDLHRPECWTKTNRKGKRYLDWLARNTVPIYMQRRWPEVPASIAYPLDRIRAEFRPYFTGHAAYMIALALVEGVTHLGFFGINYGKDSNGVDAEYLTQRGSCEYWMGVAEARGVHLVLPKGSTLLAEPRELYGYESHDEEGVLIESYRRRTVVQNGGPTKARGPLTNDGRIIPPPEILEAMVKEREITPPDPEGLDLAIALPR